MLHALCNDRAKVYGPTLTMNHRFRQTFGSFRLAFCKYPE
jgi:hypothetical protein